MFTSLNVVRMAAVDCDCTSRSATRWRRRDIGTRCSGRAAETRRQRHRRRPAPAALRRWRGRRRWSCRCAPATAAWTSPLVMRPPRPLPATSAARCPASAIILRAAGSAVGAAADAGAAGGGTAAAGSGGAPRAGADAGAAGRRRRRSRALAGGIDHGDDLLRSDRRPVGLADLGQHAGVGRREFQHHLVGLDVDQILVAPDRVARLLVPVDERRLGDRLGQHRHLDLDEH